MGHSDADTVPLLAEELDDLDEHEIMVLSPTVYVYSSSDDEDAPPKRQRLDQTAVDEADDDRRRPAG